MSTESEFGQDLRDPRDPPASSLPENLGLSRTQIIAETGVDPLNPEGEYEDVAYGTNQLQGALNHGTGDPEPTVLQPPEGQGNEFNDFVGEEAPPDASEFEEMQ